MLRPEQDHHLYFNNLKPEIKTVTDGFNLRKSLAWDSAFFTSEGVFDMIYISTFYFLLLSVCSWCLYFWTLVYQEF